MLEVSSAARQEHYPAPRHRRWKGRKLNGSAEVEIVEKLPLDQVQTRSNEAEVVKIDHIVLELC